MKWTEGTMYEELVKRLRADADYMDNNGIMLYAAAPFYRECADTIEELQQTVEHYKSRSDDWYREACDYKAKLPRWIPVTERLPEKRKYVLVRYKNNDMAVACWFDGDEDILFWRAMTDEGWCANCDTDPTHWMPLPEPPKEEI